MSLERIQIKCYQCHDKLRIKFDPKITAIIGPSDVGKSSVLRAIRWVATNRPLGSSFIKDGSTVSEAKLWFTETTVRRKKDNDKNTYKVGDSVFKAIGSGVPEDVSNAMSMDDVNFQGQHEAPFWFSLSPGEVAKRINSIVDLSIIDKVMEKINHRVRKSSSMVELIKERLTEAEESVKALDHVEVMDDELEVIKKCDIETGLIREKHHALVKLLREYEDVKVRVAKAEKQIMDGDQVIGASHDFQELSNVFMDVVKNISEIKRYTQSSNQEIPDIGDIERTQKECEQARNVHDEMCEKVSLWKQLRFSKHVIQDELKEREKELVEITGGTCPVCGGFLGDG